MDDVSPYAGIFGIIVVIVVYALIGLLLLLTISPTPERGQRLLERWGIKDPSPEQGKVAARYLRNHRRTWVAAYLAGGLLLAPLQGHFSASESRVDLQIDGFAGLLAAILVGLLVAEVVSALRRSRDANREATLVPRRLSDLLSRSGMIAYGLVLAFAIVTAVGMVAARPWALASRAMHRRLPEGDWEPFPPFADWRPVWLMLTTLVALTVAIAVIIALAQTRQPLHSDAVVDAALRTRSARVALGIGLFGTASIGLNLLNMLSDIANTGQHHSEQSFTSGFRPPGWFPFVNDVMSSPVGGVLLIVGICGWIALVSPYKPRLVKAMTTR